LSHVTPPTVTIHADGRAVPVTAGVTVAAALVDLGVAGFRRSVGGEPRGPLCGMGTCYECRVTIDGVAHRRSCLVVVADGMRVDTALPAVPAR
jgi:sarcosine oxidase subunit alpha